MALANQMSLSEFAILKSELSEQMIDEELKNYKKISDNIAERIEIVKEDINQSKEHLVTAKKIRCNKLEYSSLARLIKEQPDRKEIIDKYNSLQAELKSANEEFQKVNKNLDSRRKDFSCFMFMANELLKDADIDTQDSNSEENLIEDSIESMIIE
jgi:DNA-binding ferritin-like protein